MHTHKLPTARIKVQHTTPDPRLVGPALHGFMAIWGKLIETDRWPAWVIGVDRVSASEPSTLARGSRVDVAGLFGLGDIEILRWDPETEVVLLLRMNGLRLAFSIQLQRNAGDTIIAVEGEYELSGWKNACGLAFRLFLHRRQRRMIEKLDFLLNRISKAH
ncbi:MAG: hypothetical protein ACJA2Q_002246 [Pseudohongiellaceae bacterium]|jgi:hypothetical protein